MAIKLELDMRNAPSKHQNGSELTPTPFEIHVSRPSLGVLPRELQEGVHRGSEHTLTGSLHTSHAAHLILVAQSILELREAAPQGRRVLVPKAFHFTSNSKLPRLSEDGKPRRFALRGAP